MLEEIPTEAKADELIDKLEAACDRVEDAQNSVVKLHLFELELLTKVEQMRDFMSSVLQDDKSALIEIFGGDCSRIARIRCVLEGVHFSKKNAKDRRLTMCMRACESVESILVDMGFQEMLSSAQKEVEADSRSNMLR